MRNFNGKRVFITGGSSGIGLETAKLFMSLGASIVILARSPEKLKAAASEIISIKKNEEQGFLAVQMDVANHEDVIHKIGNTVEDFGIPDILITCAGVGYANYFEEMNYEDFDRVMKINVYGTRNTVAAILPFMEKSGGNIAIVSSVAGLIGMFGYTAYGTSKFAVTGFAECLRAELKCYNIAVSLFCPPEVDTPFVPEEAKTLPPEARAVKNMAGLLRPEVAAKSLVKGIGRNKFFIIPGIMAKTLYYSRRFSPGWLSRIIPDLVAQSAAEKHPIG